MGDLLKEAIADAKAVRETALQNAKMALEEAFTPQLKSMLSAKLKEDEHEDETEEGSYEETEYEEGEHEDAEEGSYSEDEEVPAEEGEHGDEAEEGEHGDEAEEGSYSEDEEVPAEEGEHEEVPAEEDEDNLDLEAVIRELEAELSEGDDDEAEETEKVDEQDEAYDETADKVEGGEPMGEGEEKEDDDDVEIDESLFTEEDDDDEDKDEVDEQSDSSKIGTGDNKVDYADAGDEEDPGKGAQFNQVKFESVSSELKEYKEAVKFLKNKLHEVNILNAKLLFTNKLFKSYSLNNNQKLKVVETFDRAQTTREIKLVYSTLAEQFGDNGAIVRKKSIKESASASVSSTKPSKESRKVITEETQVANRFKKLAGLIK